jgi:primosomal protein N' (replication factor Y)
LQQHNYDALAKNILAERKIAGFPPYVFQALLRAEAHSVNMVTDFLHAAHELACSITGDMKKKNIEIFDPVPAAMARLKGMERAHLLIQSGSRQDLQFFLTDWHRQLNLLSSAKIRWILDVDPIEF